MNDLYVGVKVYHYMYGAMTVTKVENKTFYTTVDSPEGIIPGTSAANTWSDEHRWYLDSLERIIYTKPADVSKFPGQYPGVMPFDPEVLNMQFRTEGGEHKHSTNAESISGVRVKTGKKSDDISAVKVSSDAENGDISEVKVKK